LNQVCRTLGVARSAAAVHRSRSQDWRDGRSHRRCDDGGLVEEIRSAIAHLPSYGYRRAWALVRRRRVEIGAASVNVKRVYRVMRDYRLLLARPRQPTRPQRRHDGRVAVDASHRRWCSDGFEFRCDNGEAVRTTFALDCCDREALSWVAKHRRVHRQ
jgi:putative transposase